jgi:NADPH-dependent 2,4-dienoyl-CoA reductase/sulfur reductase-like enzyme
VPNALEQARCAAATLTGQDRRNESVPWFWSDQYDLKLKMVGLSQGYEQLVLRGSPDAGSFCAFYLKGRRVLAVDTVNRVPDFMVAKRLVGERIEVEPRPPGGRGHSAEIAAARRLRLPAATPTRRDPSMPKLTIIEYSGKEHHLTPTRASP